ncbi:hypothetical protein T552_00937 [Pneumocystis carinii B80]|uniref:SEP domain-containing protein n=1 Tax=Pneumocystis carinii (strain B80) TaxID=1408658 RepID=A0A0W4ZMY2_PNEC8|nr:hypothetical protein T552_00937 [Pneumocystis carinii B80]KTW29730.1 hypothetical protein T552_00937 [Pneumocystis carinii B80]
MSLSEKDKEEIIGQVIEITNSTREEAVFLLESNEWNLSETIMDYLENYKNSEKKIHKNESFSNFEIKNKSKFKTFEDICDNESESEDETQDKLYSGGEKSAVYIQHPEADKDNIINEILKKVSRSSYREQDEPVAPATTSKFSGTGYVLGSENQESRRIPDSMESNVHLPPAKVTRDLIFWKDGFTINNSPLMRYDDPSNTENLRLINSGRAPLSLLNVEVGQEVDLRVQKMMDKEYKPPKKYVPFSGAGQRLGSPTPKVINSSSSKHSEDTKNSTRNIVYNHTIDEMSPTTTLQIRFGDCSKYTVRFNLTHTIGDIYDFMDANRITDDSRDYILQTIFPNKEYLDKSLTIKDAGLSNAVLVQKYI